MEKTLCSYQGCDPAITQCLAGDNPDYRKCTYYKKALDSPQKGEATNQTNEEEKEDKLSIPWGGNAFGKEDLDLISIRTLPTVIGVVGDADSGKTTFLAGLYCLIRNGFHLECGYRFVGSYTLTGWETIAWYLSWHPGTERGLTFPPHTVQNAGRVPGLLHLSFQNQAGQTKELLFTDAPGEWFKTWRINKNDDQAEGARWVYQHADAFLLLADGERLANQTKKNNIIREVKGLADRLAAEYDSKPIGLIWAKSDKKPPKEAKEKILEHLKEILSEEEWADFEVSIRTKGLQQSILKSIDWLLRTLAKTEEERGKGILHIPIEAPQDLFLSKR